MKVYTVHERGAPADQQQHGTDTLRLGQTPADRVDRAEQLIFIGDGFSWLTAELPPLMLIAHQLWTGLAIYAAALAAVIALLWSAGAAPGWIVLAVLALHVIFGFEFNELRRSALDAKGWSNIGTVTGKSRDECERRFLDSWLPHQPLIISNNNETEPSQTVTLAQQKPASPAAKRGFKLPWSQR
jgi:hypothetical protein